MKTILGRCSICGGNVSVPTFYHSVIPPEPQCERCGATIDRPVIKMKSPLGTYKISTKGTSDSGQS